MSCTPFSPMVLLIIIPFLNGYVIGEINPTFSDKPISSNTKSVVPLGFSPLTSPVQRGSIELAADEPVASWTHVAVGSHGSHGAMEKVLIVTRPGKP